jgi:hypothetical protein
MNFIKISGLADTDTADSIETVHARRGDPQKCSEEDQMMPRVFSISEAIYAQ